MKVASSHTHPAALSIDPCLSPLPQSATSLPFICISQTNGSPATCIDLHRLSEMCRNTPLWPGLWGVRQQSILSLPIYLRHPQAAEAALNNDDLINGDTLLAVE